MANVPTLGYWDIRGLAEPIRYLLHYKKVRFVDKRYSGPESRPYEEWLQDKFTLGLDFPNLPYYIHGDVKATQSTTILRYLAQKYGLDGTTEQEKLKVSLVEQQIVDFRWTLILFCIGKGWVSTKEEFVKTLPDKLKQFEAFLGSKDFLVGDDVTYVDFMAYDTFDFYRLFIADVFDDFPTLRAYQSRIKHLPELEEYLNSPMYRRWPIFGPHAKFGGGGEPPEHL